jgi:hypothetical protein
MDLLRPVVRVNGNSNFKSKHYTCPTGINIIDYQIAYVLSYST